MDPMHGLFGLVSAALMGWWSWYYPAKLVDESWRRTFTARVFLYLIPTFALLVGWVAVDAILRGVGLGLPEGWFDAGAVAFFALFLVGIGGTCGIPLPAPHAPQWMRDCRKRDALTKKAERQHKGSSDSSG